MSEKCNIFNDGALDLPECILGMTTHGLNNAWGRSSPFQTHKPIYVPDTEFPVQNSVDAPGEALHE